MKRLLLATALAFAFTLVPQFASAAIGFDAITKTNSSTASYAHSTSGANRFLIVTAITSNGTQGTVTYGGVSMTAAKNQQWAGAQANWIMTWTLMAPTSGSNTVAITQTGLLGSLAISYTGVKQTSQPNITGSAANSVTLPGSSSNTVNVPDANSWVFMAVGNNAGNPDSYSNVTERGTPACNGLNVGDSNAAVAAGNYTQSAHWPGSGTNLTSITQISFAPAPAASSFNPWQFWPF